MVLVGVSITAFVGATTAIVVGVDYWRRPESFDLLLMVMVTFLHAASTAVVASLLVAPLLVRKGILHSALAVPGAYLIGWGAFVFFSPKAIGWWLVVLVVVISGIVARLVLPNRWPIRTAHVCPSCDYDLRNLPSSLCPECGKAIPSNPSAPHP